MTLVTCASACTTIDDTDDSAELEAEADADDQDEFRWGCYPSCNNPALVADVRALLDEHDISPYALPEPIRPELVELGRALFHDKILSGSHDVSCGTCHNPTLGLTDRRPLMSGVGGHGLGLDREDGQVGGRHTQALFNLHSLDTLAIDGKVAGDGQGFVLGLGLPLVPAIYQAAFEDFPGVASPRVLAAQAMLPEVTSPEMLGFPGPDADPDNELLACLDPQLPLPVVFSCIFDGYMARLGAIPEYVAMFEAAYGVPFEELNFGHVGNAIAAYEIDAFTFNASPWDQFVAGDDCALSNRELRGAKRFYSANKGNCVSCHSGNAFTDNAFHQTLAPQFGCGNDLPKRNGPEGFDDFGQARNDYAVPWVLGGAGDELFPEQERYRWRTAPLRNVEFTAPYGRLGQFAELSDFVAHYEDPAAALLDYDMTSTTNIELVDDSPFACPHDELSESLLDNQAEILAAGMAPELAEVRVKKKRHVKQLVAFLRTLSDPAADPAVLSAAIPSSVPSGLPVDGAP
ncbi:Di-haem cytochrome c peroxidase [Plesiocystis pacifica SIR-1]|uniref:Di-haem cytochrome c peroxidase n=1 Tax=Plesiocystis pacifica SIR-1 TaxID=391625 RepID=A6GDF5_9BACT|nr:cytochrome c peroxidase [Plesiocystis pacifica]EDM76067.1 Di-haem cytochrome c peroxidase [Plesiocystis pacifica SIR-1]